jgi:hypothetical protein
MPHSAAAARRNFSGRSSSTPQPSPEAPSAATAPRCASRASAIRPVSTTQREATLSRFAISPKPQASCSNRGS